MPPIKESGWTLHRTATAGMIVGLLVSIILLTALAPTVITQSDNARAEVVLKSGINQGGASIFALMPLMWAVLGLAIVAGVVIKTVNF